MTFSTETNYSPKTVLSVLYWVHIYAVKETDRKSVFVKFDFHCITSTISPFTKIDFLSFAFTGQVCLSDLCRFNKSSPKVRSVQIWDLFSEDTITVPKKD